MEGWGSGCTGQAHAGAVLRLECARDALDGAAPARDDVDKALQLVRASSTEMRCALWDLYPEELQKVSLASAIESMANDLVAGHGLAVHCSFDGMVRRLPPEAEKGLLRISQEALSNVLKHAQASEVRIDLSFDAREARLTVRDDGRRFQPDGPHAGLGRGTEVRASIPIPPAVT